jgi:hypothetical protein
MYDIGNREREIRRVEVVRMMALTTSSCKITFSRIACVGQLGKANAPLSAVGDALVTASRQVQRRFKHLANSISPRRFQSTHGDEIVAPIAVLPSGLLGLRRSSH